MGEYPAHLFVYGTLQHPHIWRGVVKGEYNNMSASLTGFKACAIKGAVYPGLTTSEEGFANGVIYFDISAEDLNRLDAFEGRQYKRIQVYPQVEGENVRCQTYLFIGDKYLLTDEVWSFENYLLDGHDKFLSGYSGWNKI